MLFILSLYLLILSSEDTEYMGKGNHGVSLPMFMWKMICLCLDLVPLAYATVDC